MLTLMREEEPSVVEVTFEDRHLSLGLADGRLIRIPLEWYPRLLHANRAERRNWRLLGDGYAVEWPDLDEHIGIEGLLAGRRSAESAQSFDRWLAKRPRAS
jgi:hypothetical protein